MMIRRCDWFCRNLTSLLHGPALLTLVVAMTIGSVASRTSGQATTDHKSAASKDSAKKDSADTKSKGKCLILLPTTTRSRPRMTNRAARQRQRQTKKGPQRRTTNLPQSRRPTLSRMRNPTRPLTTPLALRRRRRRTRSLRPPIRSANCLKISKATTKPDKHSDNPFEEKEQGQTGDAKTPADLKPGPDFEAAPRRKGRRHDHAPFRSAQGHSFDRARADSRRGRVEEGPRADRRG